MAKLVQLSQNGNSPFEENEFIAFIKNERINVINKVKASYPSLREEQIKDIFQEVCIAIVEKAHKEDFKLTCSLFYYVYRCCWNKAEHEMRHPERTWQLPDDNIMKDNETDDTEVQSIKPEKVDQLLDSLFDELDERQELLNRVCEVVKDLPDPCDKILYGMYGTPKKKQSVIAEECGYRNADVVKTMASKCKRKFRDKFKSIYDAFKKGL